MIRILIGRRWNKLQVLGASANAVKVAIVPQPDMLPTISSDLGPGYYWFANGQRWFVCWRRIGDVIPFGKDGLAQVLEVEANLGSVTFRVETSLASSAS